MDSGKTSGVGENPVGSNAIERLRSLLPSGLPGSGLIQPTFLQDDRHDPWRISKANSSLSRTCGQPQSTRLRKRRFQIGGNLGGAVGPLLAVAVLLPFGRTIAAWFGMAATIAFGLLWWIGAWYQRQHQVATGRPRIQTADHGPRPTHTVVRGIAILLLLLFSKYFYLESLDSYYMFYLISKFHVSSQAAQLHLLRSSRRWP
jgi:hypothetical protein